MGFIGPGGEEGLAGEKVKKKHTHIYIRMCLYQVSLKTETFVCFQGDRGEMGLPGPPGEKGATVRNNEEDVMRKCLFLYTVYKYIK